MSERKGNRSMLQYHPLTINATDQLTIDAGSWQECVEEDQIPYRLISPPQTAMYRQVRSYLEEATKDMKAPPRSHLHFVVLTNRDLPQWSSALDPEVSCIVDGEMARINIEAPAALASWIDLMRADQQHFRMLVKAPV
jgi:hypothetical protein